MDKQDPRPSAPRSPTPMTGAEGGEAAGLRSAASTDQPERPTEELDDETWERLYSAAREARQGSYSPYSRYRVGAALLLEDDNIITGANVENRSFGLAMCAERVAVAKAVCAGRQDFRALAVVTDSSPPATPCGMCLDTVAEFVTDLPVLVADLGTLRRYLTLRQLHPHPFEWPEELG